MTVSSVGARRWGAAYALSQERELKRLGFVLTYGEYYFNWVSVYPL